MARDDRIAIHDSALAELLFSTTGDTAFAPVDTYRDTVKAGSPSMVTFTTLPEDTGVILTLEARNGGQRTLEVYDSGGHYLTTISIPADVLFGWSTYIAVNPNSTYTVVISISQGRTNYALYVDHCPHGNRF